MDLRLPGPHELGACVREGGTAPIIPAHNGELGVVEQPAPVAQAAGAGLGVLRGRSRARRDGGGRVVGAGREAGTAEEETGEDDEQVDQTRTGHTPSWWPFGLQWAWCPWLFTDTCASIRCISEQFFITEFVEKIK